MKKEAMLYERLNEKQVHCMLCAHQCKIILGGFGICGVRQNIEGTLYTLVYGEAIASHIDPIEKKPLYHFFPGSTSYSIATIGCNFHCGFCQNWQISQISKREESRLSRYELMPQAIVEEAKQRDCASISYTYTEPTIFFEYAYDTAKLAKAAGLYNNFVTNGYMSKEALDQISAYLDAANVDLKSFREDYYQRHCKAHLQPVLESIKYMKELGIWVEITTLVIPGENDSEQELYDIARFISSVSNDIPWHISRFHPDYQYTNRPATPVDTLQKAYAIGKQCGLRYVYLGNVLEGNDTHCYSCGSLLIKRDYFYIEEYNIKEKQCPSCNVLIAGRWKNQAS
jgi:pyruvate formate lyase activating enzyme